MSEIVFVTGAAGFTGAVLVEQLRSAGKEVYAIVRPGSEHNCRLDANDKKIHIIERDMDSFMNHSDLFRMHGCVSVFYHLAVTEGMDFESQYKNISFSVETVKLAYRLGCRKYVGIGSQAEYGVVPIGELMEEGRKPCPISPYGASKVASCYLTSSLAKELGIDWVWGRIFSVIGKYEPSGRMFPDLFYSLCKCETKKLSSCRQNWDYLNVYDVADAIIALGDKGESGEIYNIAHGQYRPLMDYVEELKRIVINKYGKCGNVEYGDDVSPFISLQPSVEKIQKCTGWKPIRVLEDSVREYEDMFEIRKT